MAERLGLNLRSDAGVPALLAEGIPWVCPALALGAAQGNHVAQAFDQDRVGEQETKGTVGLSTLCAGTTWKQPVCRDQEPGWGRYEHRGSHDVSAEDPQESPTTQFQRHLEGLTATSPDVPSF